jgi:hypothetical protein
VGTEKEDEGRPGARFHRDAERWLVGGLTEAGLFDSVNATGASDGSGRPPGARRADKPRSQTLQRFRTFDRANFFNNRARRRERKDIELCF